MALQPYLGEGLLAPGLIRLFGREFDGLQLGRLGVDPTSNNPLVLQSLIDRLEALEKSAPPAPRTPPQQDGQARLARIYGFSYLGHYYKIASPPVLRVYGQGFPVNASWAPENQMDILGVEFKHSDFVEGIQMWPVDHLDAIVRIDITTGWVRELLLDPEMSRETNVTDGSDGGRADVVGRDSGLVGRDSGLVGRDSGLVGRDSGFVGRSRAR